MRSKLNILSINEREVIDILCMMAIPLSNIQDHHQVVFDYFKNHYPCRKHGGIKWFISNTSTAISKGYRGLSVSLTASHWTSNPDGIGIRQIRSFIDWLEKNSYIDIYTGYITGEGSEREGHSTKLMFKDSLVLLFNALKGVYHPSFSTSSPFGSVTLKSTEEGKPHLNPVLIPDYDMIRKKLDDYNLSLKNVDITYQGVPLPLIEYHRSFLMDHQTGEIGGGRFYVTGGGIQTVKGDSRRNGISIQKRKIVELDYSCAHPSILLTLEHINRNKSRMDDFYVFEYDPYNIGDSFIKSGGNPDHKAIRNITKDALLIALNTSSKKQATGAISHMKYKDSSKDEFRQRYKGLGSISTKKLLDLLEENNATLSKYFYTNAGLMLQRYDSMIAMEVIDRVIKEGYTILCWHDSFVVEESVKGVLKDAMREAWKCVLGDDRYCRIECK